MLKKIRTKKPLGDTTNLGKIWEKQKLSTTPYKHLLQICKLLKRLKYSTIIYVTLLSIKIGHLIGCNK